MRRSHPRLPSFLFLSLSLFLYLRRDPYEPIWLALKKILLKIPRNHIPNLELYQTIFLSLWFYFLWQRKRESFVQGNCSSSLAKSCYVFAFSFRNVARWKKIEGSRIDRKRKIWPFVLRKNDDLLLGSRAESLLKNLFLLWSFLESKLL